MKPITLLTTAALLAVSALSFADDKGKMEENRFGGPVYNGAPALAATASLIGAGGGAENFSIAKALTAMGGEGLVNAEVAKLTKQYGEEKVKTWITVFDYAVKGAYNMAVDAKIKLPKGEIMGKKLASTLVMAGLDKSNMFNTCTMLDKAISHKLHVAAMEAIDKKFGADANATYHMITNQAMYDLAQALGMKQVKLSTFH